MPQENESIATIKVLALLNRLSLNAYKAPSKEKLTFLILNDTLQILPYQRATLWEFNEEDNPKLLGISGQVEINDHSALVEKWTELVKVIKNKSVFQRLTNDSFVTHQNLFEEISNAKTAPSIQWLPIMVKDKLVLGLWLERWEGQSFRSDELEVLSFLMQAYGAPWERFTKVKHFKVFEKKKILAISLITLLALLLIRVPLRIVAPMEVVPKDPIIITAPLDGIIEEVLVKPGEEVKHGEILAKYNDLIAKHEFESAKKQVEIIEAEVHKANTDAFKEVPPASVIESQSPDRRLSDLSVLQLQLQKEKVQLRLLQAQVAKLQVRATIDGVVLIEDPDEWHGRPVKVGDQILAIANPNNTKIRIWIPESDNVTLEMEEPIKVFLNADPDRDLKGKLTYISDSSIVNPKGVPSFIADADWAEDTNVKLGLKGTAVLYGENVSLLYWMVRRPWAFLRDFFGF